MQAVAGDTKTCRSAHAVSAGHDRPAPPITYRVVHHTEALAQKQIRGRVLERDDLQLAQANSVADDVELSDLVTREGEDQRPGQPAERCDNHSD